LFLKKANDFNGVFFKKPVAIIRGLGYYNNISNEREMQPELENKINYRVAFISNRYIIGSVSITKGVTICLS